MLELLSILFEMFLYIYSGIVIIFGLVFLVLTSLLGSNHFYTEDFNSFFNEIMKSNKNRGKIYNKLKNIIIYPFVIILKLMIFIGNTLHNSYLSLNS